MSSLSGERRLRTSAQITSVFRRGRNCSDKLFTVVFCPNDKGYARLGLAISLKATGTAVKRNRIKRLIREKFRIRQSELPGVDLVFAARKGILERDRDELEQSLDWHFEQIRTHAGDIHKAH